MTYKKSIILGYVLWLSSSLCFSSESIDFQAPDLDVSNIIKKDVCFRPALEQGRYDLSIDQMEGKQVYTIGGFGGAGITVGEGAILYQIQQFKSNAQLKNGLNTEISIVGNGIIGQMTALHLYKQGYNNVQIVANRNYAMATVNAGGYIAGDKCDDLKYLQFCLDSFNGFNAAVSGQHPFMDNQTGMVARIPMYKVGQSPALQYYYVKQHLMQPGREMTLRIKGSDDEKEHQMFCYPDAMYVNPVILHKHLNEQLNRFNIGIHEQSVQTIADVNASVVFNCTGTFAGRLNGRPESYQAKMGHYMLLGGQDTTKGLGVHNSMINVLGGKHLTNKKREIGYSLNIYPKTGALDQQDQSYQAYMGGTFIPCAELDKNGYVGEEDHLPEMYNVILKRAQHFFGIK